MGRLLGRSGKTDIVDATVVIMAIAQHAQVVTSDRDNISHLVNAAGAHLVIVDA